MKYIVLKRYTINRLEKFLITKKENNYQLIFNVMSFDNNETLEKYFKPDFIVALLGKLYKGMPIVINVTEYIRHSDIDVYGIKYVITGYSSNIYPNIQVIYYVNYGHNVSNSYSIRHMDTNVASHLIYHEHMGNKVDLNIVLNDFQTLGFRKAVKLMSLCETCKFYDGESYYMKCAVNPEKSHDNLFECRDYEHNPEFDVR